MSHSGKKLFCYIVVGYYFTKCPEAYAFGNQESEKNSYANLKSTPIREEILKHLYSKKFSLQVDENSQD